MTDGMKIALSLGLFPLTATLRGLVLTRLWAWFIAPHFHIPDLRIPISLGLSTIVALLIHDTPKKGDEIDWNASIANAIIIPLACLGFGAIYRMFL